MCFCIFLIFRKILVIYKDAQKNACSSVLFVYPAICLSTHVPIYLDTCLPTNRSCSHPRLSFQNPPDLKVCNPMNYVEHPTPAHAITDCSLCSALPSFQARLMSEYLTSTRPPMLLIPGLMINAICYSFRVGLCWLNRKSFCWSRVVVGWLAGFSLQSKSRKREMAFPPPFVLDKGWWWWWSWRGFFWVRSVASLFPRLPENFVGEDCKLGWEKEISSSFWFEHFSTKGNKSIVAGLHPWDSTASHLAMEKVTSPNKVAWGRVLKKKNNAFTQSFVLPPFFADTLAVPERR